MTHWDLDGAWDEGILGLPRRDLREWGPRLRCFAPADIVEAFDTEIRDDLSPFVLYGSGDFHYLTALRVRRLSDRPNLTVLSFDNHPDWDVRPPRWACGGWVSRVLEFPHVRRVSVWGCGNFELALPHRLFANQRGLRSGRLEVHAWAERQPASVRRRFDCVTRDGWRGRFDRFAEGLRGADVYATVDMDCLCGAEAVTNWENGLFTAADVAWALRRVRASANLISGDVCGAVSPPTYARRKQRFAAEWDRPKRPVVDEEDARKVNTRSLQTLWTSLTTDG